MIVTLRSTDTTGMTHLNIQMGDFWIVPLLYSVCEMSESRCDDVRGTENLPLRMH